MLPFEKDTIRIYHYYFAELNEPLNIEAYNRKEADVFVQLGLIQRGLYDMIPINIKVSTPIFGETTKTENNIEYVWGGFDYAESGWMTRKEFAELNIKS